MQIDFLVCCADKSKGDIELWLRPGRIRQRINFSICSKYISMRMAGPFREKVASRREEQFFKLVFQQL